MDLTLIHELAEQFSGIENPDATITDLDGHWLVELTSDVSVIVEADETCRYTR
jgi:hypothetical protein